MTPSNGSSRALSMNDLCKKSGKKGLEMKNIQKRTAIYFFVLVFWAASSAMAVTFSADMVSIEKGERTISRFFLKDHQYRMDVKEEGKTLTILVNRKIGKTRVLDPCQKTYLEFANDDLRSLMKNPFEAYFQFKLKKNPVKSVGKEIVNNIKCEKQEVEQGGKLIMTVWVSLKHEFPIKMINHLNGYRIDLQGVKEPPLPPDFFDLPPNYAKQAVPESWAAKPEKKIAITGKETFDVPIGRRIGAGGMLTVGVRPEMHISLVLSNVNQGESTVTIHPLRNNTLVTVKSMGDNVIHFKKLWDKKEISFEERSNPDSLQVEVTKGMVYAVLSQESPMWEKEQFREVFLRDPTEFGFLTRLELNITCQLIGSSQDDLESTLKVTFFKDKYESSVLSENISLKNGQAKQWKFNADQKIASGRLI